MSEGIIFIFCFIAGFLISCNIFKFIVYIYYRRQSKKASEYLYSSAKRRTDERKDI